MYRFRDLSQLNIDSNISFGAVSGAVSGRSRNAEIYFFLQERTQALSFVHMSVGVTGRPPLVGGRTGGNPSAFFYYLPLASRLLLFFLTFHSPAGRAPKIVKHPSAVVRRQRLPFGI